MTNETRWEFINKLDDDLLIGGVIVSEWCSLIVRETDLAYVGEANLATIVLAVAGIEAYLRSEYTEGRQETLFSLIEQAPIKEELRADIHTLRKFRNRFIHVGDPGDDRTLLENPAKYETEIEEMAQTAVRTLRHTIYENQWV